MAMGYEFLENKIYVSLEKIQYLAYIHIGQLLEYKTTVNFCAIFFYMNIIRMCINLI